MWMITPKWILQKCSPNNDHFHPRNCPFNGTHDFLVSFSENWGASKFQKRPQFQRWENLGFNGTEK